MNMTAPPSMSPSAALAETEARVAGAPSPQDPLWYKDAIIYQTHIKAFFDSNGDGVGDFAGLAQKLDHIQELGVTAVWLLPFYPSPLKDDGYDIAEYRDVRAGTVPRPRRGGGQGGVSALAAGPALVQRRDHLPDAHQGVLRF